MFMVAPDDDDTIATTTIHAASSSSCNGPPASVSSPASAGSVFIVAARQNITDNDGAIQTACIAAVRSTPSAAERK